MSVATCPFKPVAQRTRVEAPHVHQFLLQIALSDGTVVQDCACGYRQRARRLPNGGIEALQDGMVVGGSSVDNVVFLKHTGGHFVHRWELHS